MEIIYPLIIGLLASVFGFAVPTMLSMTAVRTSIEKDRKAGFSFSAGASTVIFLQCLVAVLFAKYLLSHPEIITTLKQTAIFILLGLGIFFLIEARKVINVETKKKEGNAYLRGIGMASLNQLAIPFYLAMATLVESNGWLVFNKEISILFTIGAVTGAFLIFCIYVIFAEIVSVKYQFIAKNINYILSLFFITLSAVNAIQLFG